MIEELPPWAYREHLASGDPLEAVSAAGSTSISLEMPSPIIGTAMHHSHQVRAELEDRMVISDEARRYEEDPGTERFLARVPHTLLPNQSRYEVDLNRPPDTAIYLTPEMAWDTKVWGKTPTSGQRERTLEKWYEFHTLVDAAVEDAIRRFGQAVVLDLHAYNYQREGPVDWRTDEKPVINLGTAHLELDADGRALKDWFLSELKQHTVKGQEMVGEEPLAQENAVFKGGYLNRRLSRTYGSKCLTLSVEYKKVFMDETAQELQEDVLEHLISQFEVALERLAQRIDAPLSDHHRVPRSLV